MENYRRVYAKIDLDALRYNLRNIRKKIGDETKLMLIIKADGYGHGASEIARIANTEKVDAFGVAILEEAILLRKQGVTKPILILGYTDESQYNELVEYNINQTIYTYEMAKQLNDVAKSLGKKATIHIKLDTGMRRIGFAPKQEEYAKIVEISKLSNLNLEGIFTHFAKADEKKKDDVHSQYDWFCQAVDELKKMGVEFPIIHCANSAAIMELKETYRDQVRSGIITYGLYPSDEVNQNELSLKPLMELKSHVVYVKNVEKGFGVSYGHTYHTQQTTKIATIPVGYADGYKRALSNQGRVLIHGKSAPIIGRVCMDQFMVDVTKIPHVSIGDEVTLFGKDQEEYISVEEIADMSGSFNYEFVCDVGKRVPRVYIENGKEIKEINYFGL